MQCNVVISTIWHVQFHNNDILRKGRITHLPLAMRDRPTEFHDDSTAPVLANRIVELRIFCQVHLARKRGGKRQWCVSCLGIWIWSGPMDHRSFPVFQICGTQWWPHTQVVIGKLQLNAWAAHWTSCFATSSPFGLPKVLPQPLVISSNIPFVEKQ